MQTETLHWHDIDELDPKVRNFIEFLSFIYLPQTKKKALEAYDKFLAHRGDTGCNLNHWFDRLKQFEILTPNGARYEINRSFVEEISTISARAGRAKEICEYLRGKWSPAEMKRLVWARWALYSNDLSWFERVFREHSLESRYHWEYSIVDHLAEGCATKSPYQFWPPKIARLVARSALISSINQALPDDAAWEWVQEQGIQADDQDALHQLFLRDLPGLPSNSHLPILRQILDGELSELPQLKKSVTSRTPLKFVFSSQEFIYCVGCFATNDERRIRDRIKNGSPHLHEALIWFSEIRNGETSELSDGMLAWKNASNCPPMIKFYLYTLLFWAGFQSDIDSEDSLRLGHAYEEAGYSLIGRELLGLGAYLQGDKEALTPFLQLLTPKAIWRRRLERLVDWAQKPPTSRETDSPQERVAWFLEPEEFRLAAKIQKIGARGDWTPGRHVAVADLYFQAASYLTGHDRRVIDSYRRAVHGPYGAVVYSARTIAALMGHPLLFDGEGNPLRLSSLKPSLLVEELPDDIKLSMHPEVPRLFDFNLVKLEEGHYGLVEFEESHARLWQILTPAGLTLPKSEVQTIQEVLEMAVCFGLTIQSQLAGHDNLKTIPIEPHLYLRLTPRGQGLDLKVVAQPHSALAFTPGEGTPYFFSDSEEGPVQYRRDLAGELALYKVLAEKVPELKNGRALLALPGECLNLLDILSDLPENDYTLQWPQGKKFQSNTEFDWSNIRLSAKGGKDWFTLDSEVNLKGFEHLTLSELLQLHREQGTRFIELGEDQYLTLTRTFLEKAQALESTAAKVKDGCYSLNPLAATLLFEDDVQGKDDVWKATRERFTAAQSFSPELPQGLKAELRPYQLRGFQWMARSAQWGVGVCLADDMGLGKTVQILTLLLSRSEEGPSLVVAPTSVCSNWAEEAQRFTPALNVIDFRDSERAEVVKSVGPGDVVICSYGILVNSKKLLEKVQWANLVLDESQAIKNSKTRRFKAATALKADFRIAATGTPVENHLGELWALFRFLNPGLLGTQKSFGNRFGSDPSKRAVLKNLIAPFLLRRCKDDVLTDLPPKTDITLKVDLSSDERVFYESVRVHVLQRLEESPEATLVNILAGLTKLRRACCHPSLVESKTEMKSSKMERFRELVQDLHEAGHRVLVFSQFVDYLTLLRKEVENMGLSYQYLDGSTTAKARAKAVKKFQEGEGDLFLISLKAGGTGLNLTAANYVIHMDPWWNPATEDQASDRAHRIGQTKPVTVYRLIGANTVEEKILRLHGEKRELVDSLLAGADRAAKLSADELLGLLRESMLNA